VDIIPIDIIITVKTVPNSRFRIRFIFGFRKIESATIVDGMAKIIDAISSLIGLSNILSPEIKLFALFGVYS